jgi:sterol 14-demethylase
VAEAARAAGCPAHPHAGAANGASAAHGSGARPQPPAVEGAAPSLRLTVVVDHDLCQGHGVCVGEAPEVFRLGANGKVEPITTAPEPALHARVRAAAKYCPQRAIRLIEQ